MTPIRLFAPTGFSTQTPKCPEAASRHANAITLAPPPA